MSIQALREEREELAVKVRNLVEKDGEWTSSNDEEYNKLVASIDGLDAKIDRRQKVLDLEASKRQSINDMSQRQGISDDEAESQIITRKEVVQAWMRHGRDGITPDHINLMKQSNFGFVNTMSTGTGSEGGFTTDEEFNRTMVVALKDYGGMRSVAQVINGTNGQSMNFPTGDATSEEGEIVGENADVSDEDPSFGTKAVDTFKYSSKAVAVPFELLQDSLIDIEAYITEVIRDRLGRITEKHFATGTGAGQPNGAATAATAGLVGAGTTAITYDELIDLEHSVDPAYRRSGSTALMFHDTTLRFLRKLKDGDGRPLWQPSLMAGVPATLNGQRYVVNQSMPVMAANAKSILFGDFRRYVIRDIMQFTLFRMTDSAYTKKGQVGFLAFMRSGGNLVDVGGAIKAFQNAA